ncbi:radical SAM protein [Limisalsivibrio acetivorans]|uniref:radical SAM protein n=1 Tax=Limisalsivibrio acetivorans TaxID=1304888 RepID=UPI0003B5E9EC|nr:radical SAM/SPASM domain-containing protein [Limisalsivibrio acetivorans]
MRCYWELSKKADKETIQQNLNVLLNSSAVESIHIPGNALKENPWLAEYATTAPDEFYTFAERSPEVTLLRFAPFINTVPGTLIDKMYREHKENGAEYTYADLHDIYFKGTFEIVESSPISRLGERRPFFPDDSLGLFGELKFHVYHFDVEDYSHYLKDNFDRYFKYPVSISLESTYLCNLRCDMCCYHSEKYDRNWMENAGAPYMDFDKYTGLIDEIASFGRNPTVELVHRGEPLLHKRLVEMVEYGSRKGIKISLVTNALELDADKSKSLLDAGLTNMWFSMDGADRETYESIRRGSNYEKVIKNIHAYIDTAEKSSSNTFTAMKYVLSEANAGGRERMADMWLDKVNYLVFQIMKKHNSDGEFSIIRDTNAENLNIKERMPCLHLFHTALVTAQGNVGPCTNLYNEKPEHIIGNVFEENSLYGVWAGEEFRRRRELALEKRYSEIPLCNICDGFIAVPYLLDKRMEGNRFIIHDDFGYIYTKADDKKLYPNFTF